MKGGVKGTEGARLGSGGREKREEKRMRKRKEKKNRRGLYTDTHGSAKVHNNAELGGAITLLVNLGDNRARARHRNRQISVNCRVPATAAPRSTCHTIFYPLRSAERPFPPALLLVQSVQSGTWFAIHSPLSYCTSTVFIFSLQP